MISYLKESINLSQVKKIWRLKKFFLFLILFNLYIAIILSIRKSIYLPTYHLDGAFQTVSGLLRIKWGEVPGIDFFPYLGIAPLLLLLPFFILFGGDLGASVMASHFITLGSLQLIAFFTLYFIINSRNKVFALVFSAIPIFLVYSTNLEAIANSNIIRIIGLEALFELINPGNSLRPLRSLAPWLLLVSLYFIHKRVGERVSGDVITGLVIGIVAGLWSNDYALSTGFLGFVLYLLLIRRSSQLIRKIVVTVISFFLTMTSIFSIQMLNGWENSYLKYNYIDVRGDQYWYFAPWDESTRVNQLSDLLNQLVAERTVVPICVLLMISTLASLRKSNELIVLSLIGTGLFIGGGVSTIGGHTYNYFSPFKLWGLLVILALIFYSFTKIMLYKKICNNEWIEYNSAKIIVGFFLVFGVTETYETWTVQTEAKSNKTVVWDKRLGGYIPSEYIPKKELNKNEVLVEEYWGLTSTLGDTKRTSKTDSVIHALGSQRTDFKRDLRNDDVLVVTSSQSIGEWFNWNLSANWWFYRSLFEGFDPKWNSPITIRWKKTDELLKRKEVDCHISSDGQSLKVLSDEVGLYDLEIHYKGPGKFSRSFSLIENNLNYAYGGNGFVALDPGSKLQQFPAVLGSTPSVLKMISINAGPREVTRLSKCSATLMVFPRNSGRDQIVSNLIQASESPFNLTDQNWKLGIAKFDTAFFILNTPSNLKIFRPGSEITFVNEEKRTINRIENSGPYLNIFLSGNRLIPEIHGYPNKFKVTNE